MPWFVSKEVSTLVQQALPSNVPRTDYKWSCLYSRDSKGVTKKWNFHFDLQLHPTALNGTYSYCRMIGFIPIRAQNF